MFLIQLSWVLPSLILMMPYKAMGGGGGEGWSVDQTFMLEVTEVPCSYISIKLEYNEYKYRKNTPPLTLLAELYLLLAI